MQEEFYIQELKNGSRKAFDFLYRMYAKRLYIYCYQYTKSHEDTEEIVQDVFVKLWLNKERIQQEKTIKYLLFTIAKNHLINIYRSRINSPIFEEYVHYCNMQKLSVDDTSSAILYDDFVKQIGRIKENLTDTQRKIIDLSLFKQLSHEEIADELSISKQTVKNQLSLSLKIVREYLNKNMEWLILLIYVN